MIRKYKTKPDTVTAVQWMGNNKRETYEFLGATVEEGKSIALFSDASQQKKNKSLALFKTVTGGIKGIGENVNAKFLKTKRGKDYLINIEERLQSIQIHQFSPSITSGHSFESAKMDSINILSSKTILPTQVIQSASRFRLNNQISLSFNNPFMPSEYEMNIETIKETDITINAQEDIGAF
mgnify:CR=1 FL=1